jgi:hypothetical protein
MSGITILLNQFTPGAIDSLELDCILTESHHYQNEVTEFPIEAGFSIGDHVIHKPEQVTLEAFNTNSPIIQGSESVTDNRVKATLENLLLTAGYDLPDAVIANQNQAKVVTIVTGLRIYTNMVLTDLTIPRDHNNANALQFTATFKHLIILQSQTVFIANVNDVMSPGIKNKVAPKVDTGSVDAPNATQEQGDIFDKMANDTNPDKEIVYAEE